MAAAVAKLRLDNQPIVANLLAELNVRCKSVPASPLAHEDAIIAEGAGHQQVPVFGPRQ